MDSSSSPLSEPGVGSSEHHDRNLVSHLQKSDVFREYRSAFETATGMPLVLRAAGAFQEPLHGSRHVNPLCALMAQRSNSCAVCLRMQQQVEQQAVHQPRTLECVAGLSESAIPIRAGEKLIGYLQTGQVFLRAPTKPRFNAFRKEIDSLGDHAGSSEIEHAYFGSRVIDPQQYFSILQLLSVFALHLASTAARMLVRESTAEFPAITKARAFISENLAEEMSLSDVARVANMSTFYFCKYFKRSTGLTFTAYLAKLRVETVKHMLLSAEVRISEAAYEAGFQSLSQFNRVFRHVAGESPTDYRDRVHASS